MSAAPSHTHRDEESVSEKPKRFVLEWRRALLGSDLPSSTRLLLLTLSVYMDDAGLCWPNVDELVKDTGLSRPTVVKHARIAERAGWITTSTVGTGQGWRSKSYQASLPKVVNLVNHVERRRGKPDDERGKADTSNVVKPVNSNSSGNSSRVEVGSGDAREEASPAGEWQHLTAEALVYRPQIEAFLTGDDDFRRRQITAAFKAGMTPPPELFGHVRSAIGAAGSLVTAAAVVYVANKGRAKTYEGRRSFFDTILQDFQAHAERSRIGTDAATESALGADTGNEGAAGGSLRRSGSASGRPRGDAPGGAGRPRRYSSVERASQISPSERVEQHRAYKARKEAERADAEAGGGGADGGAGDVARLRGGPADG